MAWAFPVKLARHDMLGPSYALDQASREARGGAMALNLNSIMLGSEDPKRLADFYTKVLGAPNPDWSDDTNGWFGFPGRRCTSGYRRMC